MGIANKNKYRIIEDSGKEYILVSQVPEYAVEYFNSRFRIPSYPTIRYYVAKRILNRPQKMGKETFFEISYIMSALQVMRVLLASSWHPSVKELRAIVQNAHRANQLEKMFEVTSGALGALRNEDAVREFIKQASSKNPGDINVQSIVKKYPKIEDEN